LANFKGGVEGVDDYTVEVKDYGFVFHVVVLVICLLQVLHIFVIRYRFKNTLNFQGVFLSLDY